MKKSIKTCIEKNKALVKKNLSFQNFGNLSIRVSKYEILIKPSGVELDAISDRDIPLVDIRNGNVIKGKLKPSIDTPIHIELYKKYNQIKSIAHCHSKYATAWSQACKEIPLLGTTHADFSIQSIHVTNILKSEEIKKNYEENIGKSIIKKLQKQKLNPLNCPGILVANHAAFAWGDSPDNCVKNMELIEFLAETAYITININNSNGNK